MKLKFVFILCCVLLFGVNSGHSACAEKILTGNTEIKFSVYDEIPWDINPGTLGTRSAVPAIPFAAMISNGSAIDINFLAAIGEIEIIISQNGTPVYSSSENILSVGSKTIQLSSELSGTFLLEIKGANGAYAYGSFEK